MTAELCVLDSVSKSVYTLMSSSGLCSPEFFTYLTQSAIPTSKLTSIANTTPTPMSNAHDEPGSRVSEGSISETHSESSWSV